MSRATELFEIQTRLAVGDAALVYRALDQSGRLVALKLLLPEEQIAHPLDVESLLRDAPQIQTITGVNIVQLLDAFPDEDGTILVYEYADGHRGLDVPKNRPVGAADAVDIAAQLLSALRSGERQRYPHGDLKPSDTVIMDLPDGRPLVMVLDWGLANYRGELTPESYAYTAPERLSGAPPSHAADLFSAGAVLYYLFTGSRLLPCTTREEFAAGWDSLDANALGTLRPDLPEALVRWVAKLIAPDPSQRHASAVQALEELAFLRPPPPPAVPEHIRPRTAHTPQPAVEYKPKVQPRPQAAVVVPVAPVSPAVSADSLAKAQKEIARLAKRGQSVALFSTYLLILAGLGIGGSYVWQKGLFSGKSDASVPTRNVVADMPPRKDFPPGEAAGEPSKGVTTTPQMARAALVPPQSKPRAKYAAVDSFEYPPGSNVAGLAGGSGWEGPWTGDPLEVEDGTFAYFDVPSFGGKVLMKPAQKDVKIQRVVSPNAKLLDPVKGGSFFFALSIQHSDAPFGPESEFQFNALDGTAGTGRPLRVIVGDQGSGFEISMHDRREVATVPNNDSVLCIVQGFEVKPEPGGKWTVESRLWLNPDPDAPKPPPHTLFRTMKGVTLPKVITLLLRKKPTPTTRVDEVRYGTQWAEMFR